MALQNRHEQDAQRLKGVNLLDDPIDVEFGTFTSLANWIHGLLYSLRKKRGVDDVPGGASLPISICIPTTAETVYCGDDIVMVCGDTIISVVGMSRIICGVEPLVALSESEITCA